MSIRHLFNMGNYGIYVWAAYGITLLVFSLNLFLVLKQKSQAKKYVRHFLTQLTKP